MAALTTISTVLITLASLVTAIGVYYLAKQSKTAVAQYGIAIDQYKSATDHFKLDHERTRRQNAIDLILGWTSRVDRSTSLARKIIEALDAGQCQKLCNEKPFEIDEDLNEMLNGCFAGSPFEKIKIKDNKKILLDTGRVAFLRWLGVTYLNNLEATLIAWRHGMADNTMIKEQFRYLLNMEVGHKGLSTYREKLGGSKAYPSIEEFITELKQDEEAKITQGKDKIA